MDTDEVEWNGMQHSSRNKKSNRWEEVRRSNPRGNLESGR